MRYSLCLFDRIVGAGDVATEAGLIIEGVVRFDLGGSRVDAASEFGGGDLLRPALRRKLSEKHRGADGKTLPPCTESGTSIRSFQRASIGPIRPTAMGERIAHKTMRSTERGQGEFASARRGEGNLLTHRRCRSQSDHSRAALDEPNPPPPGVSMRSRLPAGRVREKCAGSTSSVPSG